MPGIYVLENSDNNSIANETQLQLRAGTNNPLELFRIYFILKDQTGNSHAQGMIMEVIRKTSFATVTSKAPVPYNLDNGDSNCVVSTTGCGFEATAEGTDGDVLLQYPQSPDGFFWQAKSYNQRIRIKGGEAIGMKFRSTTSSGGSRNITSGFVFKEL